jgi:hypothetical protein
VRTTPERNERPGVQILDPIARIALPDGPSTPSDSLGHQPCACRRSRGPDWRHAGVSSSGPSFLTLLTSGAGPHQPSARIPLRSLPRLRAVRGWPRAAPHPQSLTRDVQVGRNDALRRIHSSASRDQGVASPENSGQSYAAVDLEPPGDFASHVSTDTHQAEARTMLGLRRPRRHHNCRSTKRAGSRRGLPVAATAQPAVHSSQWTSSSGSPASSASTQSTSLTPLTSSS